MSLNSEHGLLDEAIAALRTVYTEEPPPRIELFLAARMRTYRGRKATRFWALTAASAALILSTWLATRPIGQHRNNAPISSAHETQAASAAPQSVTHPVDAEHVRVTRRPKTLARQNGQPPGNLNREDVSVPPPFVAIPYAEPLVPFEQLDIYRVQLPRSTLGVYGVPARAGDLASPVTADVAVGSDGIVRAVRFVQ
jgi:hypothetical protein